MVCVRHTTFTFTLDPTARQAEVLCRHVGGSRFAFNQCLRIVQNALDAKKTEPSTKVPWSGFDLINAFNAWKLTEEAGKDDEGRPGLPWRAEVCAQVFEEAAVDLGRALATFTESRRGERKGKPVRFPRFKKKSTARASFRLRNKRADIRAGASSTRSIRFPKLGEIAVRECTRNLRRMVRNNRAKILFATISLHGDGRWRVTLNIEAADLHPTRRHSSSASTSSVGIDRGLKTFAVVADSDGRELDRIDAPKPLRTVLPKLRKESKALSRKKLGSRNRQRARARVSKRHATHGHLVLEDLCTSGLMQTRLARSLADSAWAMFAGILTYEAAWLGGAVTLADRFFPSTRRCSACGSIGQKLTLSERAVAVTRPTATPTLP